MITPIIIPTPMGGDDQSELPWQMAVWALSGLVGLMLAFGMFGLEMMGVNMPAWFDGEFACGAAILWQFVVLPILLIVASALAAFFSGGEQP